MLASILLSLREGLEAALIIGIVLGVLRRTQQTELTPMVWRGAATAGLLSLLTAIFLNLIGAEFEGNGEVIFEGTTMLLAAVLLTWMVFWMQKQARNKKTSIENEVVQAVQKGGKRAIFLVAFVSILREGVELAVFLMAARLESKPIGDNFRGHAWSHRGRAAGRIGFPHHNQKAEPEKRFSGDQCVPGLICGWFGSPRRTRIYRNWSHSTPGCPRLGFERPAPGAVESRPIFKCAVWL